MSSCIDLFKFPSQKQERKGGWGPSFASNLTLSFRVLIRPYWPGQVYSLIKDTQIDLDYKNQNVRGRQALKKGQSLIFMYCSQHFCTILRNLVYCFCAYPFLFSSLPMNRLFFAVSWPSFDRLSQSFNVDDINLINYCSYLSGTSKNCCWKKQILPWMGVLANYID